MPVADIIAWCLMPNHFHLIIHANEKSIEPRNAFGGKAMQEFAYRMGVSQSSYAQAINNQQQTSGSLFRQKAKQLSGPITQTGINYLESCFFYVINNPRAAALVDRLEQWPYSCYHEYIKMEAYSICNQELLFKRTGINAAVIKGWSNWEISNDLEERFCE